MQTFTRISFVLLIAALFTGVSAQFAECRLPEDLERTVATWDGAAIGLNQCGRNCVSQQNCNTCLSQAPLTDRTCVCQNTDFIRDMVACIRGSIRLDPSCQGQDTIFNRYQTGFCGGAPQAGTTRVAPAPATNPVATTRAPPRAQPTTINAPVATNARATATLQVVTTQGLLNSTTTDDLAFADVPVPTNATVLPTNSSAATRTQFMWINVAVVVGLKMLFL